MAARDPYERVRTDEKPKSIWDDDVDYEKVLKLPPRERSKLFPNDFAPDGSPLGDF